MMMMMNVRRNLIEASPNRVVKSPNITKARLGKQANQNQIVLV